MANLIGNEDWQSLLKTHWLKTPFHLKTPFKNRLFEPEWFLSLLKNASLKIKSNEPCEVLLFDKDGQCLDGRNKGSRLVTGLESVLPKLSDESIESYFEHLALDKRFENFGFFIREPQYLQEQICSGLREIARFLFQYIPLPRENLGSDVFIGNYLQTPFGAHKDNLDNFLFMVSGRKKLYLWEGHLSFDELTDSNAMVFELEQGDMLYWPSSYWHIGKNVETTPSISINLDYYDSKAASWESSQFLKSTQDIAKMVTALYVLPHQNEQFLNDQNTLADALHSDSLAVASRAKQKLINTLQSNMLEQSFMKAELQRKSAMFFRTPYPMRDASSFKASDCLYKSASSEILHREDESNILLAINGFVESFVASPIVREFITRFNNAKNGDLMFEAAQYCAGFNSSLIRGPVDTETLRSLVRFTYLARGLDARVAKKTGLVTNEK